MITILRFFPVIISLIGSLSHYQTHIPPLADRFMAFEDLRFGEKLVGLTLSRKKTISRFKCAIFCAVTPKCKSFNFLETRTCELNSGDAFTLGAQVVQGSKSAYHGMKMNNFAKCFQNGEPVDIQIDPVPNVCRINQKRQDAEWSQWEKNLAVDSPTEWKRVISRECYPAAHGGTEICEGKNLIVLEWLKFVHDAMVFDDARSRCQSLGGDLFSNLTGAREQVDYFRMKTQMNKCFWVGIEKAGGQLNFKDWRTMSGEIVANDLIVWGLGQPNPFPFETKVAGFEVLGKFDYLHNVIKRDRCQSVCQMPVG